MHVARHPEDFPCGQCGCDPDGIAADGGRWKIPGVITSRRCLRRMLSPASVWFLELYRHYKNGILPISGGLLDQPAVYYRAMSIIDGELAKHGDEENRK